MPPSWGRPPGGATGVGRYFEGVADDVYRFQELDSDDEKNGISLDHGFQQQSNSKLLDPDDLYFNDMDIRAWERRATALGVAPYAPDYDFQEEDEGYYDDAGEPVTAAEYEELLFQRVLDKIRIARAAGNPDVQLSPEEIEAYQSKLHGERSSAARPQARRSKSNSTPQDVASVVSGHSANHAGPSSSKPKSKKSQRTSLFSSKPKKEKPSSRKRAPSNASSAGSHIAPGFVIPGPDGQPLYTPINPYQGSLARDPDPSHGPPYRSASGGYHVGNDPSRSGTWRQPARDVPGSFPSAFAGPAQSYYSGEFRQGYAVPGDQRQMSGEHAYSPPAEPPKLVPFPVEQYQYHSFSPSDSSSSQASPQLQYVRRPSAPPSEVSYTAMPRRVPVPVQRTGPVTGSQVNLSDSAPAPAPPVEPEAQSAESQFPVVEVIPQPVPVPAATVAGIGKDGERRRKGARKKKA